MIPMDVYHDRVSVKNRNVFSMQASRFNASGYLNATQNSNAIVAFPGVQVGDERGTHFPFLSNTPRNPIKPTHTASSVLMVLLPWPGTRLTQ